MQYLSHPIADILRNKIILMQTDEEGGLKCYNFTNNLERGSSTVLGHDSVLKTCVVLTDGRRMLFQIMWDAKIHDKVAD